MWGHDSNVTILPWNMIKNCLLWMSKWRESETESPWGKILPTVLKRQGRFRRHDINLTGKAVHAETAMIFKILLWVKCYHAAPDATEKSCSSSFIISVGEGATDLPLSQSASVSSCQDKTLQQQKDKNAPRARIITFFFKESNTFKWNINIFCV